MVSLFVVTELVTFVVIVDDFRHDCVVINIVLINFQTNPSKQQLEENSHLFNSGTLHHGFAIRSVYKNRRKEVEVTTKQQNGWVTVDYILYSTSFSEKYNKFIEGNLKLVSRLELLSGQQCRSIGSLPSNSFPSDHLSLVAKFLLCSQKRQSSSPRNSML